MAVISGTFLAIGAAVAAVSVATTIIVNSLVKVPKADTASIDAGTTVQRRRSDNEPLSVLVGERILGGAALYDNSYGGEQREFFSWVTVISARPCDGFVSLYLNGTLVQFAGDPTQGEVAITNPEFRGKPSGGTGPARVWVRVFLGDDNSQLGSYLASKFPDDFSASDRAGEMCVVVLTAQNTNDDFGNEDDPESQQGKSYIPLTSAPEMKWRFRGARIYDPRIEGSSFTDKSTHVYSNNAILVDQHFDYGFFDGADGHESLIVGNGYPQGLIDEEYVKQAADHADERGYKVNGLLRSASPADQDEIHKCMNATRIEAPGFIRTIPESFRRFWGEINLEGLGDAYIREYSEEGLSTEVFNEMHGTYVEPLDKFANKSLPVYTRQEWIAQDSHIPRVGNLPLNMVTDGLQALTLLKQEVNVSRATARVQIDNLPMRFLSVPVGDLIDLVGAEISEINGRRWVVEGLQRNGNELIRLSLVEWVGDAALILNGDDPELDLETHTVNRDLYNPDGVDAISSSLISNFNAASQIAQGALVIRSSPSAAFANGALVTNQVIAQVLLTPSPNSAHSFEWSWYSGGADITIDSPNSASTTFSRATTGNDFAIAKCTVELGELSTDVLVSVNFTN